MTPITSSTVIVLGVLSGILSAWGSGSAPKTAPRGWVASGAPPGSQEIPSFREPLPPVEQLLLGPASVFGNLSPAECRRRLKLAPGHEAFAFLSPRNGIALPMRFTGPLLGVEFKVPPAKSPYGALDCRQALLWTEVVAVLDKHAVTQVGIDNFYRDRARVSSRRKSQHAYGLAADVTAITFGKRSAPVEAVTGARLPDGDGRAEVEADFLGRLGAPVCGPDAEIVPRADSSPEQVARAIRMRDLVCDLARKGLFHHILTPNYNLAHKNHLHLDLQRDNKWFSVK